MNIKAKPENLCLMVASEENEPARVPKRIKGRRLLGRNNVRPPANYPHWVEELGTPSKICLFWLAWFDVISSINPSPDKGWWRRWNLI